MPPSSPPVTVPKLQKAWQRVMIRRPSARSVWLALAFIATSIVAIVSPQKKSARASVTASRASAGRMKTTRKPEPPQTQVSRVPKRRMIRATTRKPSIVPAGIANRQKASVSTSRPRAAFTSGMRGNQTASPTALSAKTICSGRIARSADIGHAVPVTAAS